MDIEYEATFPNVDKNVMRDIFREYNATLQQSEFLQRRVVFSPPSGHEIPGGWLRVRDEGTQITMSLKIVDGNKIENQQELVLRVSNFDEAVELLKTIGCQQKAYQENRRERWAFAECEVTIDTWPFLETFVEIEGPTEEAVKLASQKLGFDFSQALFCSVDTLYSMKYGLPKTQINDHTPKITFDMENPFTTDTNDV